VTTTEQMPIDSGFGAASTTTDVLQGIDLSGRVAVVTGGNSGLGFESARALAAAGARVVIADREHDRAAQLSAENPLVSHGYLDLREPDTIDAFAREFLAGNARLDIQINSAGVMACPLTRDTRGFEQHLATNHLGHFQLTARLWPALVSADRARVVAYSSMGHRYSDIDFDDINWERRPYDPSAAYGQSKTANALFAVELDRRGRHRNVRSFAVHPGSIPGTQLARWVSPEALVAAGLVDEHGRPRLDPSKQIKTPAQGAATAVWCATSPRLDGRGGLYCENCDVAGLMTDPSTGTTMAGSTHLRGVMSYAIDPDRARRLWDLTESLLGVQFPD
jgi:NAD(P)-dependent dehydrogenase (short-subunit alcohol dehydrogenase family)